MKTKTFIVSFICFGLLSNNVIYANNELMNISNDTSGLNTNLINQDMFDSEGNLKIPEIEIPDDLPDFNVSLREKYDSALGELRLQGFEVNNTISNTPHNYGSDIENFFYNKFPDTKLTTEDEITTLMSEFTTEFDNLYNGPKEELPSKEATLIWDKENLLNSAVKPQGYLDALKETSKELGKGNTSLKNEVANKIDSTHSNINPNAKPTTPNTPSTGQVTKPTGSSASKPNFPTVPEGTKPEKPTLEKPSPMDAMFKGTKVESGFNKVKDTISGVFSKAESGLNKIIDAFKN